MIHECKRCHVRAENLKKCSACSVVWYCNSECQKNDWLIHLVDCNPGRLITTADRLVASIYSYIPPEDDMTLQDYGFTQTPAAAGMEMRLQVYRILVVELQVKAKTIHRWMEEGKLATMMRETFDAKLPPHRRQEDVYYLWFCNNQSTFGRGSGSFEDSEMMKWTIEARQAAWGFLGRNPSDSHETIQAALADFSADEQACFQFVSFMYARMHPGPGISLGPGARHLWIYFGYCGCDDPRGEDLLSGRYIMLLRRVSYDTFYQAYISSTLPKLLADNGLAIHNPFILDVLSSRAYKSVWFLKDFVCSDDELARKNRAIPAVGVDYGFINCQNVDEVIALRNAYKQVFIRTDANPLALHEACIRGELFEHVGKLARLKPVQLFKRLMKNPYPLEKI